MVEDEKGSKIKDEVVDNSIHLGSVLAVVISYSIHQSILWAIIHGFFGWFYVIYYMIIR